MARKATRTNVAERLQFHGEVLFVVFVVRIIRKPYHTNLAMSSNNWGTRSRLVAMGDDRLDDLRSRLDDIAEELADIGLAKLKEAVREDNAHAAAEERRLARARRAVIKAAALLAGANAEDGSD
jgi:hypothetical protein